MVFRTVWASYQECDDLLKMGFYLRRGAPGQGGVPQGVLKRPRSARQLGAENLAVVSYNFAHYMLRQKLWVPPARFFAQELYLRRGFYLRRGAEILPAPRRGVLPAPL